MKAILLTLTAMLLATVPLRAQRLVPMKNYGKGHTSMLTLKNKPNGTIYRLRVDKQCTDLPGVPETQGLEMFISEPTDMGWMALYRLPMSADDYNFVVVLYDHDKRPQHTVNLCDITDNRYCEVQDVRWDADTHHLLFNMACPSYAEMIGGKGSKLYCYDVENDKIVWQTDYLVSNDIFILDRDFVFCSYGFTSEKKFLYMLDKRTGNVYSKLPMVYKVEYLELAIENGREMLYALDYNDNLYSFAVKGKGSVAQTGGGTKTPEVFTVVFATSDDGFLNIRQQPSTKAAILGKLYGPMHGLGSGVLLEEGTNWSLIQMGDVKGWVYNPYLGRQTWFDGTGKKILVAGCEQMPIFGENYVDEDEGYPLFTTVKKGTVIADQYDEIEGYYVLKTGHDYLFIRKGDVTVKYN